MKKLLLAVASVCALSSFASDSDAVSTALKDIERSASIINASWSKTIVGRPTNIYMADQYNLETGWKSGASDIWPLTAAIEAHCSLLEALELAKAYDENLYNRLHDTTLTHLDQLIDNLEYYRGAYTLASYASLRRWQPYAVPRSGTRGGANVSGTLNVYDDQMWLARELTRAYLLTDNDSYLELATYLTDYVLDGWDCWHDENGNEYGGITWGPGYNSKHACSNAPIIQPLVWLSKLYEGTGETVLFYTRDKDNKVVKSEEVRSELYLEYAKKVYDWQRANLYDNSGVYFDMMGADNTIQKVNGYRAHVNTGGRTGAFISYNTGTMIAGGAELYAVTGDETYKSQVATSVNGSRNKFATYVRSKSTFEFKTDDNALNGFNTWFNNVLMRSYVDAYELCGNEDAKKNLGYFQFNLDYAFDNYLRNGMLPIHLLTGWGDENITKPFHQFSFASEYAMLAVHNLKTVVDGIESVTVEETNSSDLVYNTLGVCLGHLADVRDSLPRGIYIVGGKKMILGN